MGPATCNGAFPDTKGALNAALSPVGVAAVGGSEVAEPEAGEVVEEAGVPQVAGIESAAVDVVGAGSLEEAAASLGELGLGSSEVVEVNAVPVGGAVPAATAAAVPVETAKRPAAVAARPKIAAAAREDLRRLHTKKKRPTVTEEDLLTVEPDYELAEVAMMTNRKVEDDGSVWYFVKGAEAASEDERCSWVIKSDCAGSPMWMRLVDDWMKAKKACNDAGEASPAFFSFIRSQRVYITLGKSDDYTCVYAAVESAIAVLGSKYHLTPSEVEKFEAEYKVDRQVTQRLTRQNMNQLLRFLARPGRWHVHVFNNSYKGSYTGYCGLAYAPGVYLCATADVARDGHCFVVEVTDEMEYFFHEGKARHPLGDYRHAHSIFWVRRLQIAEKPSMEADTTRGDFPVKMKPLKSFGVQKSSKKKKARRSLKKKMAKSQDRVEELHHSDQEAMDLTED
ncbi:hypothetical protein BBJ28_00017252 [Nothophytophthora sp. Chile5]|nr:hypothetical protein BBJ28_00017252 [Nothophytophthora sp. Chile5]